MNILQCKKCGYPGITLKSIISQKPKTFAWMAYCGNINCEEKTRLHATEMLAVQDWNIKNAK